MLMTTGEALAAFLARYGIFLAVFVFSLGLEAWQLRRWWKRNAEILDVSLIPEWTDRRVSYLPRRATGSWLGKRATLRKFPSTDKSQDALEATLEIGSPGRFILERGDTPLFRRAVRIGAPPPMPLMNPDDQRLLRVRSDDRTPERIVSSGSARAAVLECLREPADEISLRKGKLRVYRRFSRREDPAPIVRQSWNALKELARVLA